MVVVKNPHGFFCAADAVCPCCLQALAGLGCAPTEGRQPHASASRWRSPSPQPCLSPALLSHQQPVLLQLCLHGTEPVILWGCPPGESWRERLLLADPVWGSQAKMLSSCQPQMAKVGRMPHSVPSRLLSQVPHLQMLVGRGMAEASSSLSPPCVSGTPALTERS